MPRFSPIVRAEQLPKVNDAIERAVMDFKGIDSRSGTYDPDKFEMAKDIAAFANHLGGVIVIGAVEQGGYLRRVPGITPENAKALRAAYSKAAKERCSPRVAIDFDDFASPVDSLRRVVVVNVSPSLNLVGVRSLGQGESWAFPVRSGTDTDYLEPGELAMYMTPHLRRVAVMLARIPVDGQMLVASPAGPPWVATFVSCDEEENLLRIKNAAGGPINIPLDRVISVYENAVGTWVVSRAEP